MSSYGCVALFVALHVGCSSSRSTLPAERRPRAAADDLARSEDAATAAIAPATAHPGRTDEPGPRTLSMLRDALKLDYFELSPRELGRRFAVWGQLRSGETADTGTDLAFRAAHEPGVTAMFAYTVRAAEEPEELGSLEWQFEPSSETKPPSWSILYATIRSVLGSPSESEVGMNPRSARWVVSGRGPDGLDVEVLLEEPPEGPGMSVAIGVLPPEEIR